MPIRSRRIRRLRSVEGLVPEEPVVIVTGGAGHVGRGLCRLFARDGWAVVVADRDADGARKAASEAGSEGPDVFSVSVDVTDEASASGMVDQVLARFGRIDALINNAGLYGNPTWTGPMLEVPEDQWHAVMAVNVWGPVVCVRAVAPVMKRSRWGRIVNVSSQGAYKPAGVYTTSKLAVHQVTWNLARELGPYGITVNCVAPGLMDVPTAYQDKGSAEGVRAAAADYIIKRLGRPEDLYAAMKYFVSKEAEWCTGQWLMVNGGSEVHL
jgi:NAD(P)-dependent dehydrogenase (short-subunit alcohol dehydrogenase family)